MSDLEQLIRQIVRDVVRDELAKQKPANDVAPDLVTVAEYARARSISESTVRQAIRDGRLAVERIGRAVRIPADATIRAAATTANEQAVLKLMRGGKVR